MQKISLKNALLLSAVIILLAQKCNSQGLPGQDCNNGNCRYCGSPDNCLTCNAGFSLFRNTNLAIQRNECTMINCSIPNCKLCASLDRCWECTPGFYMREYRCEPNICKETAGCRYCGYDDICQ